MRKNPKRPISKEFLQFLNRHAGLAGLDCTALDTPERIFEYLHKNGFITDGCTDIESAIKANENLELVYEDLGDNDAYIMRIDDQKFRIAINSTHHKNRQKFSMAHEYVHYQLHRDHIKKDACGEKILYRNSERNPIEYQANQVASELLMPKEKFVEFATVLKGNVKLIADKFKVSPEAVRVRANVLGFVINGE